MEIEPLHLARTGTYHSTAWMATTIMSIVIDAVGETKLYLEITPGLPILFLVILHIFSSIHLYIKKKANQFYTGGQK
ncbi:MAG: hypothetical protein JRI52_09485 [Deltaproteobacteria bacterium]|nr:hypothetical protein [Deltaproteobacteria bacterium]